MASLRPDRVDHKRKVDLAEIHVLKKRLGLEDDVYRAFLEARTGQRSAKDLSRVQRMKVLFALRREAGVHTARPQVHPGAPHHMDDVETGALLTKVEALLADAKRPWAYANSMARHMFKVDHVQFCSADQLQKLVAALVYDARKRDELERIEQARKRLGMQPVFYESLLFEVLGHRGQPRNHTERLWVLNALRLQDEQQARTEQPCS